MGKVKNLIWDEIEYDTYEETTPTWFRDDPVRAVPPKKTCARPRKQSTLRKQNTTPRMLQAWTLPSR